MLLMKLYENKTNLFSSDMAKILNKNNTEITTIVSLHLLISMKTDLTVFEFDVKKTLLIVLFTIDETELVLLKVSKSFIACLLMLKINFFFRQYGFSDIFCKYNLIMCQATTSIGWSRNKRIPSKPCSFLELLLTGILT